VLTPLHANVLFDWRRAGNVSAQIAYSTRSVNQRWHMYGTVLPRRRAYPGASLSTVPHCFRFFFFNLFSSSSRPARYYRVRYALEDGTQLHLLFLDACNLVCYAGHSGKADYGTADCRDAGTALTRLEQLQWLKDRLGEADAAEEAGARVWRVLVAHWPLVSAGNHGDSPSMQETLLPLVARHRVDAVFAGHDHALQHLVAPAEPEDDGDIGDLGGGDADAGALPPPQVFVSGAGGYKLDPPLRPHANLVAGFLTHGFLTLDVTSAQLGVRFYNTDRSTTAAIYAATVARDA